MKYLIWSNEHSAWWMPRQEGYTTHWLKAGVYTEAEAINICRSATMGCKVVLPPPEMMYPVPGLPIDSRPSDGMSIVGSGDEI